MTYTREQLLALGEHEKDVDRVLARQDPLPALRFSPGELSGEDGS